MITLTFSQKNGRTCLAIAMMKNSLASKQGLLAPKTAPLGATLLTKPYDQQRNLMCLLILPIYSLPCPFLSLLFNCSLLLSRTQISESTWSYLSYQCSSNLQFPRWRCFHQAILRSSLVFLWSPKSPFKRLFKGTKTSFLKRLTKYGKLLLK